MKTFNILYKGQKIHSNLTHEECAEILEKLSENYYTGEAELTDIELEEN